MSPAIPPGFQAYAARGPEWAGWLDLLPGLVRELMAEWSLRVDGPSRHGNTALVLPVRTSDGSAAVLKVVWPHPEAEHEALALQHWGGRGAVRLLRADPRRWALLLERLEYVDLSDHWDVQACEIVGGLYGALHVAAPPQLDRLSGLARRWAAELADAQLPMPRRMVDHARSLARSFAADESTDGVLVHTDLHFHNVLAGGDEWRAIDPKPLSGDPHFEVAPLLWNRLDEFEGRVRAGVRDRFLAVVDAAELDEDRARDWVIVRMLVAIMQGVRDNQAPDRAWVTAMLAIAKAVQE